VRFTRLDRLRHARNWSFPGSAGGLGASSAAGFDPVGQVFGTTVAYLRPVAFDRCYVTASGRRTDRTSADPYNPLLARLTEARGTAFERAVAECRALGGDGIIGARVSSADFFSDSTDFTVEGTAVRARSSTRPAAPFTTHVGAQDLAKLLSAGWMPFALVIGTGIAACHFDNSMFQQTRRGVGTAGNQEVSGYTRAVNDARREARDALAYAVRIQGGQGAVVQGATLHFSERTCPSFEERLDYVVEATIVASAIVSFERSEPAERSAPLAIMRLDRDSASPSVAGPPPEPGLTAGPSLSDRAFAYWTGRRDLRPE
jgi:uncharacterized protein YbjQ (UPF0145 family)